MTTQRDAPLAGASPTSDQASRAERQAPLVGVALAGGASRRMGRDKARIRLRGTSLIETTAALLESVADEVLVADRGLGVAPEYRSIEDGPGAGPMAGILGAAAERPGQDLLVLACDLPEVPVALLRRLAESTQGDACVPRWRRGPEPLCALYRPAALAAMAAEASAGRLALYAMLRLEHLSVCYLEGDSLAAFGPPERVFLNLNTPEDLAKIHKS